MLETTFSSTGESVATTTTGRGLVEQRDRAVLHLAGRVGVRRDVGDLLELERALEADRPGRRGGRGRGRSPRRSGRAAVRSTAAVRPFASISSMQCGSRLRLGDELARGARPAACRAARRAAARAGTSTATWQTNVFVAATPISRPARVNSTPSASRVACEPITLVTASTVRAALAREPHGGERVRRLAGLRDADHEVALAHDRVAVAVLRGDVHLHRHARPLLDRVAADQAGVVRGAAGDDHDALDAGAAARRRSRRGRRGRRRRARTVRSAIVSATRVGLLVDLLEHERLVAALLGDVGVPVDALDRRARRGVAGLGDA